MSEKIKSPKPGWRLVRLGDVVENINDFFDRIRGKTVRYVAGEHIDEGDLRVRRYGLTTDDLVPPTFNRLFKTGDVLFHSRNIKKLAKPDFDGLTGEKLFVLRTKDQKQLMQEFLPFLLQGERFGRYVQERWAGSTNKFLNKTPLMAYEFALPPIDEQLRIISAIAAFDDCFEACRTLQANGYTLLKSLLDRMWCSFPLQKIGALVDQGLIAPPQDGNHGEKHPKAADYVPEGVPFVMASDLKGGKVDFTGCSKIPDSLARTLRIGFARSGDVLLSHKGTVGEVARLRSLTTDFVMLTPQVTYYRVIDIAKLEPDWLYFAFQTPGFKRLLEQYGKQSTRSYVGITAQRELSIPIAQAPDQLKVIAELVETEMAIAIAGERATTVAEMRQLLRAEALA